MKELNEKEIEELTNLVLDHDGEWLDEYVKIIKSGKLWDIDFLEYKKYKIFMIEFNKDIKEYVQAYIQEGGSNISLDEAGWVLFNIATKKEYRLNNSSAES